MTERSGYRLFTLSVDDLEWTQHWLSERRRCDMVMVWLAEDEDASPRVHIRAVESKSSTSADPIKPSPSTPPFGEAIEQVVETLTSLAQAAQPTTRHQLVEDLRFASFVEHLASVVLATITPLRLDDHGARGAIASINALSRRSLGPGELVMDGIVVCTQYRTGAPIQVSQVSEGDPAIGGPWPIRLVRCGSTEVDAVLGAGAADFYSRFDADVTPTAVIEQAEPTPDDLHVDADSTSTAEEAGTSPSDANVMSRTAEPTPAESVTERAERLARDLYLACRHRGFGVDEPVMEDITLGSSLISVPMPLAAGAALRPIESALDDLARELGVRSVEVENDPDRAFHVRFLIARTEREFPPLPESPPPLVHEESRSYHGLYLGRGLEGRDFVSYLSSWPHLLVSGTTGSGKTTFVQNLLRQIAMRDQGSIEVILIDGKGEFDYLNLLGPEFMRPEYPEVQLGSAGVLEILEFVRDQEIPRRQAAMRELAASFDGPPPSPRQLFARSALEGKEPPFAPLLVVLDEFAEIMQLDPTMGKEFERRVQQITQIGRSSLVHLVLATQRPDANVLKGAIKANLPARVALQLPTHHDSMTVLGGKGAERLLGRGDLIFQSPSDPQLRLQGYSPP